MRQDVSTAAQREEILQLQTSAARLTETVARLQQDLATETEAAEREHQVQSAQLQESHERQLTDLEDTLTDKLESARLNFEQKVDQLNNVRNLKSDDSSRRRADEIAQSKADQEAARLQLNDSLEVDIEKTNEQKKKFLLKCRSYTKRLEDAIDSVQEHLDKRSLSLNQVDPTKKKTTEWSSTYIKRYKQALKNANEGLVAMKRWPLSRLLDGILALFVPIVIALIIAYPLGMVLNFERLTWIPATLIATIGLTVAFRVVAQRIVTSRTRESVPSLHEHLVDAATSLAQARSAAKREAESALAELNSQNETQLRAVDDDASRRMLHAESDFENTRRELETIYQEQYQQLEKGWERETESIRDRYGPRIDKSKQEFAHRIEELRHEHGQRVSSAREQFETGKQEVKQSWLRQLAHFEEFQASVNGLAETQRKLWLPLLNDEKNWTPSNEPPSAIPLGRYELALDAAGQGENHWSLPAALTFPSGASLLVKARDEGRQAAIGLLQNAMLRMLMSVPPGKLRFTIFDPTGLGQNFSAFMHLADFDERLVGSRIWTESGHVQQRLADLTEHMENVIQKYLRNEFASIQEYNEYAGEVAEPFRVLVIANFPTHFSEEATRRLISIANSGARCGVYTLISVDMNAPVPRHMRLEDLTTHANCLEWREGKFSWEDENLRSLALELDEAPNDQQMTSIIKSVGRHAENSNRVEVPFASVAPPEEEWWSSDCSNELNVPLGRAGATQQLSMRLGRGTSQHVLISGKTGSGKSTLLHALVTNASMIYSPEELEFFLIDFKKGVEFKPYADLELPHARVVAIESEREFGLSVLQRLDQELRTRGDQFRAAAVQSLAAYREARPDESMPRILLVVDEFQEFFVADDKVAHEASLLLDRLVRQGRAFGMHLVLGSQTLAGAYSLARSTIGQMAVRIALQCSAADAHLILSEDNTAARLLGRPGEAIYNDANGLLEGNHPFQVVWLSDAERSDYLERIRRKSEAQAHPCEPAIVFEGHAAADLADNQALRRRLEFGPSQESAIAGPAWLGAAVAIKEPTAAVFRPQSGANLLIVGQNQELANGMLISAMVSLASARPQRSTDSHRSARFLVLDGEHDNPISTRLSEQLTPTLPFEIDVCGPRESTSRVERVLAEARTRREQADQRFEPIYVIINDLARFRELKPNADDFGFSGFGEEKADEPGKYLSELLRDGPAVNIHVIVWADSYNNVTRWFERAMLRDFAYRVLFQMSATDSSNLMDSAAASHLGQYRAIFYDDDRGQHEKFRPYGIPSSEFLAQCGRQLSEKPSADADSDIMTGTMGIPTENSG